MAGVSLSGDERLRKCGQPQHIGYGHGPGTWMLLWMAFAVAPATPHPNHLLQFRQVSWTIPGSSRPLGHWAERRVLELSNSYPYVTLNDGHFPNDSHEGLTISLLLLYRCTSIVFLALLLIIEHKVDPERGRTRP
jgi:hypothetical protein